MAQGDLVDEQADAVAGAVGEVVAVAGGREAASRQTASRSAPGSAGRDGGHPGRLRLLDRGERVDQPRVDVAEQRRAGHVGVVAVDERAEVDQAIR